MTLATFGEIAVGGANHTGEANCIGLHRLQFNVRFKGTILFANTGRMEIEVHTTESFDEGE